MKIRQSLLLAALSLALVGISTPAHGQDGFAFKLGGVFNSSTVEQQETDLRLSDAAGWNVGAEYVFPGGWGVGLSGYTAGSPDSFDASSGSLVFLADLNYFFRLPLLPIAPYAGLHVGLGTYALQDVQDGARPQVDFGDRGYQLGVRFQPTAMLGIDAQFRRISGSLADQQETEFETRQFVLGVTLF